MRKYSRYSFDKSYTAHPNWWDLIIIIILSLCIMFGSNACTAIKWNGGICPDCKERYELCSVYKGVHYYACPDCGAEVSRFGGR